MAPGDPILLEVLAALLDAEDALQTAEAEAEAGATAASEPGVSLAAVRSVLARWGVGGVGGGGVASAEGHV